MSIRTFNKLMSAKGCTVVMSFVLLVAMIFSFAGARGCGRQRGDVESDSSQRIVAKVGNFAITESAIQDQFQAQTKNMQPRARDEALYYGVILSDAIEEGLALIEAKQKGVSISDDQLTKNFDDQTESGVMQARMAMMQKGLLKGTSEKDFEDAYQKLTGKSIDQAKKDAKASFLEKLKDPAQRVALEAAYAASQVPKVLATRLKPSDQELKDSYKSLMVKQILLNGPDVAGQIAEVQADLKKGSPFEQVIDRYSKDKPPIGKKLSEVEAPITRDQLMDDMYAPLRSLKVGDISPVVVTSQGSVIYKVTQVKNDLPKDFEKNKEALRDALATTLATNQYRKDLKELGKSVAVDWIDPGYHLLYDYFQLSSDVDVKSTDKPAALKAIIERAEKAERTAPSSLAFYAAAEDLKNATPGKPDAELQQTLIDAIQAVSEFAPGPDLDLELADIYLTQKDAANFALALIKASQDNTDYSSSGQATYVLIQTKIADNSKLLTPDMKKQLADAQATWKQTSDEQKAEQAEAEKAAAEQAKQEAAEKKQYEAEQKAEKAKEQSATKGQTQGPPAPKAGPPAKP